MYGLHGNMIAQPGQRDTLIGLLMGNIEALRQRDGCYIYVISTVADNPEAIWITEVWRSQADHRASLEDEGVRALITQARPLIASMPEHMEFTPVGGLGLPNTAR